MAVTTLNPKCVTVSELYGEFNPTTVEWTDGLLSYICRRYAKESRMLLQRSLSRKKSQSHIGSSSIPSARSVSRTPSARSISTTFSTTSFDDGTEGMSSASPRLVSAKASHMADCLRSCLALCLANLVTLFPYLSCFCSPLFVSPLSW